MPSKDYLKVRFFLVFIVKIFSKLRVIEKQKHNI
jgi:hypothetical protein